MDIEQTANVIAKERILALGKRAKDVAQEIEGIAPATAKVIDAFAKLLQSYTNDDPLT